MAQTRCPVFQQLTNQGLIPCALHMGQNELALWVHQFRFPSWLRLTAGKAMPFIGLKFGDRHIVDFLLMIVLPMCPDLLIQAAYRTRVHPDQTGCALEATAISQMLGHRNGYVLGNLTIPQGCVFAFAEFPLTAATTQVTDVGSTVDFSDYQIMATFLAVQVAVGVNTC
jgi:hypothetical protein